MEHFEIGTRFESYEELMKHLNQFCIETKSKFWKRDARTIQASRAGVTQRPVKASLVYYEVKFICIYGGTQLKSKAVVRHRPQRQKTGCPAYLRFRVSEDGYYLVLVAMNLKHNHELTEVHKIVTKMKRRAEGDDTESDDKRSDVKTETYSLDEMSDVEDEGDVDVEYIEVHVDMETSNSEVNFNFRGLIAPTLTPFKDDLEKSLNLEIIPGYAKFLSDSGIKGILVNGTSGEGMSMSVQERKAVTEAWVKAVETTKQHLMVQVGGAPLPDVIELAKHAEQQGVNSLLCLPELYFKPTTVNELINYLAIVGKAASNTPLLYYHIPSFSNVNIDMGEFLNAVAGKIPNFVGIKYTCKNLEQGVKAVKANDGNFAVFLGNDQVMAGAYTLGFNSAIATTLNMFPKLGLEILENIQNSNVNEAKEKQDKLNSLIDVVVKNGTWVSTMKEAMSILTPIKCGPPREPLARLTAAEVKEMATELKAINL